MSGDDEELGTPLEYLWVPSYATVPLRMGQRMGIGDSWEAAARVFQWM